MNDPFQTLPPMWWIEAYMLWRLETGQARLGAKMSVQSLLKEFQQLRPALKLALNETWDQREISVMKKVLS